MTKDVLIIFQDSAEGNTIDYQKAAAVELELKCLEQLIRFDKNTKGLNTHGRYIAPARESPQGGLARAICKGGVKEQARASPLTTSAEDMIIIDVGIASHKRGYEFIDSDCEILSKSPAPPPKKSKKQKH